MTNKVECAHTCMSINNMLVEKICDSFRKNVALLPIHYVNMHICNDQHVGSKVECAHTCMLITNMLVAKLNVYICQ